MKGDNVFLIFMHIPKTAGTTLRKAMAASFSDDEIIYADSSDPFDFELTRETLRPLIKEKPNAKAIIGHFMYGVHEIIFENIPERRYKYITFFRDPVQRMVSEYFHNYELNAIHGFGSLGGYEKGVFDYLMTNDLYGANIQAKYISGRGYREERNISDIDDYLIRCTEIINKDFIHIGFSGRFEYELSAIGSKIGKEFSIPELSENVRGYPKPHELFFQEELDALYKLNEADVFLLSNVGISIDPRIRRSIPPIKASRNLQQAELRASKIALRTMLSAFNDLLLDREKAQEIMDYLGGELEKSRSDFQTLHKDRQKAQEIMDFQKKQLEELRKNFLGKDGETEH